MADVIKESAETFRPQVEEKKLEFVVEAEEGMAIVDGDRDRLLQAMTNLISNAVDACRFATERGDHWVRVATFLEPGGQLRLEVADNGRGIPKELCGEVFSEMFTTKGSGGTGLGLLVVYRVVCAHRGQITVLSEEGVGTVFNVILPLSE